jgi:organic radical activating enzyme
MISTAAQRGVAAPVMEVFASIQGEGWYVGEPQVFLRLRGCPLRCRYCDTPASWSLRAAPTASGADARRLTARIDRREDAGGRGREDAWATPLEAAIWISDVEPGPPRSVSVTGGEPLLWPGFLRALKPLLGTRRLHLETAGADPRALAAVRDVVDHISLDLKAPVDMDAPEFPESADALAAGRPADGRFPPEPFRGAPVPTSADDWADVREAVLPLVAERDACAKIVVTEHGRVRDYAELLDDVERLAPELPVIIQPATPMRAAGAPDMAVVCALVEHARELGLTVRLLPQVHRGMGLQ